jgi:hypothetical protein
MHGEDYYPVFAIAGLVTVALLCVSYSNIFRNVDSRYVYSFIGAK